MYHLRILFVLIALGAGITLHAQIPKTISYQGLLTTSSGTPVTDGSYRLQFRLFNVTSAGIALWNETHSGVVVERGTFNIILGSFSPLSVSFNQTLFVEVETDSGPGISSSIIFSPRSELTNAPYAFRSDTANVALSSSGDTIWTKSGSDIYRESGNVGIGTTVPADKLSVVGNLRIEKGNQLRLNNPSDNSASYIYDAGTSGESKITFSPSGTDRVWIDNGGNIGIGTASPVAKLDVIGDANFNGNLIQVGGNNNNPTVISKLGNDDLRIENHGRTTDDGAVNINYNGYQGGTTNFRDFGVYDGKNTNIVFVDGSAGNVGIGTTNPVARLEVADGYIRAANGSNAVPASGKGLDLVMTGSIGYVLSRDLTAGYTPLPLVANASAITLETPTAGTAIHVNANSNVGIGTTSPTKKFEVAGSAKVNDTLFASNVSSNSPLRLQTAGTTRLYVDDANGNVGIGTSTPGRNLEVIGSGMAIKSSGGNFGPSVDIEHVGGRIYRLISTGVSDGAGAGKLSVFDATGSQNRLVIDGTGNIGIGTTSPGSLLHTAKDGNNSLRVQAAGGNGILEYRTSGGTLASPSNVTNGMVLGDINPQMYSGGTFFDGGIVRFFVDGTFTSGQRPPSGIGLFTNIANAGATEKVRIQGNGNVGIGTSTPAERLHVNGNVKIGNATIRSGTGSPEGVVTGNVGDLYLRTDGGAGSTFYVKESGNGTNTGWAAK